MKKQIAKVFTLALLLMFSLPTFSQEFTGLNTKQFGENVNIEFSIVGEQLGQLFNVVPTYSTDGGRTFQPMKSVSGYVGPSVLGGKDQVIIWDVLRDLPSLQGNVQFKLTGNTSTVKPLTDHFSNMVFELVSLHRTGTNQIEMVVSITNNGADRDLKLINGLVTISDFKKRNFDAQRGRLGEVLGGQRHSTPQRTIKSKETVQASFTFDRIPADFNRVMRLTIGAEILTFSQFGLDKLEISALQFRDIPISDRPTTTLTAEVSRRFEATTSAQLNIQKPLPQARLDNTPPMISILQPAGISLSGSDATRGKPLGQSRQRIEDRRMRSIAEGEGIVVSEPNLFVRGTASHEAGISEVIVSGHNAKLNPDGTFEANVSLKNGRNDIVIRAISTRKSSLEQRFVVFYQVGSKVTASDTEELDLVFDAPRPPRFYAFIIGVNDYPDPTITDLNNPINDAQKLINVLTTRYMFDPKDVVFIKNATRAQIIDEFDKLTRRVTKNDNLLIFYAGHGYFDLNTELGYWLPSDASTRSTANWMANSQIKDYVAAIKSKHTLLIADACFSGGIFKTRKAFSDATDQINRVFDKPSRKAMTSGALTEVPDQSAFLKFLVQRLEENTLNYLSAEELFSSFKTAVMNISPTVPMYGDIKDTGDEGGDFLFVLR